jgi:hypothetical protein
MASACVTSTDCPRRSTVSERRPAAAGWGKGRVNPSLPLLAKSVNRPSLGLVHAGRDTRGPLGSR